MEIYTDGSCLGNGGVGKNSGGWAYIIVDEGKATHSVGGSEKKVTTTNNRMEMMAVIEALRWCYRYGFHDNVIIYSDSKYVIDGYIEYMAKWKENGWTKKKGELKNVDLWKILDKSCGFVDIELVWVKGHNGNEFNEMADVLAKKGAEVA